MTGTLGSESLLHRPAPELEQLLLRIARTDAPPAAARESALRSVAAAAVGGSVLSGAAALGSRVSLAKGTSWLVVKWLAIGAGAGLFGIGVVQGLQELGAKPTPALTEAQTSAKAQPTAQPTPLAVALAPALAAPPPETAAWASTPASQAAPPAPSASALAGEPRNTSRTSSEPSVMAFPPANTKRSLTHELTLLEQTRSALQEHAVSRALQTLDQYRAEFPHGSMASQADALRVQALSEVSAAREQKP
jgi:hypothetical protein